MATITGSISQGMLRGEKGLSAYDVAVKNGFVGTEVEWLASLKGEQGDPGNDGQDGTDGVDGKELTAIYADNSYALHFEFSDGTELVTDPINSAPGYTPVKGTDYWTDAEKQEIIAAACQAAIAQYPVAEEEEF